MNTLNFKGKTYELYEVDEPKFQVFDPKGDYNDVAHEIAFIGTRVLEGLCIHIKDKFYAPKLIENEY